MSRANAPSASHETARDIWWRITGGRGDLTARLCSRLLSSHLNLHTYAPLQWPLPLGSSQDAQT